MRMIVYKDEKEQENLIDEDKVSFISSVKPVELNGIKNWYFSFIVDGVEKSMMAPNFELITRKRTDFIHAPVDATFLYFVNRAEAMFGGYDGGQQNNVL
jgi:hypothetical protein